MHAVTDQCGQINIQFFRSNNNNNKRTALLAIQKQLQVQSIAGSEKIIISMKERIAVTLPLSKLITTMAVKAPDIAHQRQN